MYIAIISCASDQEPLGGGSLAERVLETRLTVGSMMSGMVSTDGCLSWSSRRYFQEFGTCVEFAGGRFQLYIDFNTSVSPTVAERSGQPPEFRAQRSILCPALRDALTTASIRGRWLDDKRVCSYDALGD
jgi:hypothetical protein